MIYYEVELELTGEDDFTIPFTAGPRQFEIRLTWPTAWEEQYNALSIAIQKLSESNPLYDKTTRNIERNYNYIQEFSNITDIDDYLDNSNTIPFSILSQARYQQQEKMSQFIALAQELQSMWDSYTQQMCYRFTLTDDVQEIYSGEVRNGAWITDVVDNSWELQFLFVGDLLTKTQQSMSLQVGVLNE